MSLLWLMVVFITPFPLSSQERATLVIGTEAAYPPYSFVDDSGEPAGMNVDLVRALCLAMDRDCRIRIAPWADIRQALSRGEIDAVVGMYYSPERNPEFDFSQPFTRIQHYIVGRRGERAVTDADAIRDTAIAVMRGDLMHDYVVENRLSDEVQVTASIGDALSMVSAGEVDFALVARVPALHVMRAEGITDLEFRAPVGEPVRYTFAATHEQSALVFEISDGLSTLTSNGTFETIRERWLSPLEGGPSFREIVRTGLLLAAPLLLVTIGATVWVRSLRAQVAARTRALAESQERIAHLNSVLLAIRNVNQLITQEGDRDRLLEGGVRALTETRGYLNAWIALFPKRGRRHLFYESEVGEEFGVLASNIENGRYPQCVRSVLTVPPLAATAKPRSQCRDCPLSSDYAGRSGLTSVIRYAEETYGVLCVSVPPDVENDPDEQGLVLEVAGDLAYALHDMELEEERDRLQERLEMANRIVEQSPVVLFQWSPEIGRPVTFVSSNVRRFGYEQQDLLSGRVQFADIVHPADFPRTRAEMGRFVSDGVNEFYQEYRIVDPQGTEHWISDQTVVVRNPEGGVTRFDGVLQDITDRKRHEHDLEFQSLVLDQINDRIAVTNPEGDITYVNSAQAAALASEPNDLVGRHVSILGDDVDASGPKDEIIVRTMRDESWSGTVVRLDPSGNRETIRLRTSLLQSLSGDVVGMIFIGTDISELSQAHADVERGRAHLNALFESAKDLIYLQDPEGTVIQANGALAEFTGVPVDRIASAGDLGLTTDLGRWVEEDTRVLSGVTVRTETTVTLGSTARIVETIRSPVYDAGGAIIGICGVSRDVTDSVEARSRLAKMARENEVLLRELYHRTKNNMQVVASMVALKRYGVSSDETIGLLQELEARIYAIALVHQKLYQSHDLSRIDLADYLSELADQIESSYGFRDRGISLETDLASTPAVIDQAVPIGLAINELVSNAMKHAFVGRSGGTVRIGLRSNPVMMIVTVSDDGVGMPPGAREDEGGIGLQTLHALVEMQLGGAIELRTTYGTHYTLRIPTRQNDTES